MQPYKSPGPDSLHSYVLKTCASSLAKPLCILFKQSLTTSSIPNDWKCANITPVFKKGSKSKPSNYRPISLTSQVAKILESIVRDTMQDFLLNHDIINPQQHGFRQGKSCFTNLLETFEDLYRAVDEKKGIDIAYLDYRKTFDSVPHQRLLHKLQGYGITGSMVSQVNC